MVVSGLIREEDLLDCLSVGAALPTNSAGVGSGERVVETEVQLVD